MVSTTVLLVPASHPSLLGHFSGNPIVPGVVILDLVARCVRKKRPELRINGFPFVEFLSPLSPLSPGSEFELHCFAATIHDRVYLLTGRHGDYRIELHNVDTLLDLVNAKQGCLLLGVHIGSFEVMRALAIEHRPFSLKVLMYPDQNQTGTGLLTSLNPELAGTVIPLGQVDTVIRVHECLQRGEAMGMLGDRAAGDDKTVQCEMLGDSTLSHRSCGAGGNREGAGHPLSRPLPRQQAQCVCLIE